MKENLAAINVVCNGKLINRNSVPLLFYWNGETDLVEDIKNNIDFRQWLEDEEILKVYFDDKSVSVDEILKCFKIETNKINSNPLIYEVIK